MTEELHPKIAMFSNIHFHEKFLNNFQKFLNKSTTQKFKKLLESEPEKSYLSSSLVDSMGSVALY